MNDDIEDAKPLNKVEMVEYILTNHPEARENDSILEFLILEHFFSFPITPEQWAMIRDPEFPKLETFRRHRAKIQNG